VLLTSGRGGAKRPPMLAAARVRRRSFPPDAGERGEMAKLREGPPASCKSIEAPQASNRRRLGQNAARRYAAEGCGVARAAPLLRVRRAALRCALTRPRRPARCRARAQGNKAAPPPRRQSRPPRPRPRPRRRPQATPTPSPPPQTRAPSWPRCSRKRRRSSAAARRARARHTQNGSFRLVFRRQRRSLLPLPPSLSAAQVLSGRAAQLDATVRTLEQDLGFTSEELSRLQAGAKASARAAGASGADASSRLERALYGVKGVLMGSGPGGDLRGLMTPPPAGTHTAFTRLHPHNPGNKPLTRPPFARCFLPLPTQGRSWS
jgi:hypothetical protein